MAVPDKYGLVFRYLNKTWLACYGDNPAAESLDDLKGVYKNFNDSTLSFVEVYLPQQDVCVLKDLHRLEINDSVSRIMIAQQFPELMKFLWNRVNNGQGNNYQVHGGTL
jgi:hypothetical protein